MYHKRNPSLEISMLLAYIVQMFDIEKKNKKLPINCCC